MAAPQFTANGEAFVVVPLREYEALRRLAEEAGDAADEADAAMNGKRPRRVAKT